MNDPRARHFWDDRRLVGTLYQTLELGEEPSVGAFDRAEEISGVATRSARGRSRSAAVRLAGREESHRAEHGRQIATKLDRLETRRAQDS